MPARSSSATEMSDLELVITRVLDAPRQQVFAMWTEPEHLARWWGPRGFALTECALDLRPGGAYRFGMRGEDGTTLWIQGVYQEVIAPERIVCTFVWTDGEGHPTRPSTLLEVGFDELGARTRLTLRQTRFVSTDARDDHRQGWNSTLDRLAEQLNAQ